MLSADAGEITRLLREWRTGNKAAFDNLLPLVYSELRRMASQHMRRENAGHILQTSALLNEAYVRLVSQPDIPFEGRAHFYAVSSVVMRQILVDYARRQKRAKRGGGAVTITIEDFSVATADSTEEILAVDEALTKLAQFDERKARVVEMRFFGAMSVAETAAVLGVSENTVIRDWSLARAWLRSSLSTADDA